MASSSPAVSSGDLLDLVTTSGSTTVYPTDDTILSVLQSRFRNDLPYSRIGSLHLIAVNPLKSLADTGDASAKEYEERCYKDTTLPLPGSSIQPHLYEMAAKMYLLMRRKNESQSVVFRGITGSGKTESSKLLMNQVLRLSTKSKKEAKLADQIKAFMTVLDSFGNSKTLMNPNASRHGRYIELHFNERGRINSAKVLAYGLDKSRLLRLTHEERSFHIFYQLLAGSTSDERDLLNLEDASDYALLASSNCYRLPGGPFSDDAVAMHQLRGAMKSLGFKAKHFVAITNIVLAVLLLGNLQFVEGVSNQDSSHVANTDVLDHIAHLLGVSAEDLEFSLTNKTNYVRKELYSVLLTPSQAALQRNSLVQNLYAILFAYVVETANHKVSPNPQDPPPPTQIVLLDQPGFQSRGASSTNSIVLTGPSPLIAAAYGQNSFDEFCINFQDELLHSYVSRNVFEDIVGYNGMMVADGISLHAVSTMDNSACVELIRGAQLSERAHRKPGGILGVMNKACSSYKQGKTGDRKNEDMLQDLMTKFGVHTSFVASPTLGGTADRNLFGINHYASSCTYDVSSFIEKDADLLDSSIVSMLRSSTDSFVSKLFSGPSMAVETHHQDPNTLVQAQVSSRSLRHPTTTHNSSVPGEEHGQLDPTKIYPVTTQLNYNLSELFSVLDRTQLWSVSCIRPNDSGSPNSFDKRRVKAQIRSLLLPDIVARRRHEFVVDLELDEFCERYVPTMKGETSLRLRQCAQKNGWTEGKDFVVGHRKIWLTYSAWKLAEDAVRESEKGRGSGDLVEEAESVAQDDMTDYTHDNSLFPPQSRGFEESSDNLLYARQTSRGNTFMEPNQGYGGGGLNTPYLDQTPAYTEPDDGAAWGSEWDKKGQVNDDLPVLEKSKGAADIVVNEAPNAVEEVPTSKSRRWWLRLVWLSTWFIPSFLLSSIGRMKRPDVRLAWREKVTICLLIFWSCAFIIFYIIEFGRLLCPDLNKAWSIKDVGEHTGDNDFWVAIQGRVYDVSNFVHGDHSDITGSPSNTVDILDELAGQDLTGYFPPPLVLACSGLVTDPTIALQSQNFNPVSSIAVHTSGVLQSSQSSKLRNSNWYTSDYLPKINQFYKGPLVVAPKDVKAAATSDNDTDATTTKTWAIYQSNIYDLTDYVNTASIFSTTSNSAYNFLDSDITDVFKQQAGQDITKPLNAVLAKKNSTTRGQNMACLDNAFFVGKKDFRKTARCQLQNYLLVTFSSIIVATIAAKFVAALQLTSKRYPEMLDKFVICQIPCYTEDEDSLRRTIDSLAALKYDDKRKLLFIICDGNIIGSGNDRPTPRIVLDVLGVDPKLDPEPLLFKSVGEGSKQINYGKIYSGLYEFEGHVVPYLVVVKVGKPTERSRPGNRGKRDSQILLMHYLNRVHFDAPMSPLELEIYHQMRNVIGIDPAFYEYLFTVDADTSVAPESLNRLVARAVDDSSIIGICGETKLDNEEGSWWTMIQVYEYYISHHLAKAFESLFGSVTCLPGCFSLYRIRTSDKGRPIIISNRIIDDYAEGNVDTLHKKNLFSLGEDRYLTTLMMKHFPTYKMKFTPDAVARTIAPESWSVLLSQRRRWINSTIHNLCELVFLPELCGFCLFSMRFIVFIDLLGTLILPATAVYLVYLIVTVATGQAPIPVISLILIGTVYGLQAIIFILKREFMLVGWMVIYLLSYPVYSFFLPIYSFWCMDDFSWGNTRLVVGEGNSKKVIVAEDDKFDESMIPLKKFSEYEAEAWEHGSHHSGETDRTGKSMSKARSRSHAPGSESPHSYVQASQTGDYYRDTNLTYNNTSNPNLRLPNKPSLGNLSQSHSQSQYGGVGPAMSQYGGQLPQLGHLPFAPFGTGTGSVVGSEFDARMQMAAGFPGTTPSMYGMGMAAPRNTVMTNLNMFGGGPGSVAGSQSGHLMAPGPLGMDPRPMSTFSLATSVNPFAGPSMNPNPSDEELYSALKAYLSTQDLMTVTKKTTREAIAARFPKADLTSRKDFLNQAIDGILSES